MEPQGNYMKELYDPGFGFNDFVTKTQPFPIDGLYRTNIISSLDHLRSDLVVPLVFMYCSCAMAGAPTLYYRSLGASTLLRIDNGYRETSGYVGGFDPRGA